MSDTSSTVAPPAAAPSAPASGSAPPGPLPVNTDVADAANPAASVMPSAAISDAIATDEELQAALADADQTEFPSLDDGRESDQTSETPTVPVVIRQSQNTPPPADAAAEDPAAASANTKKLSFKIAAKPGADAPAHHSLPPPPKPGSAGGAKAAAAAAAAKPAPPAAPALSAADAAKQAAAVGASLTGLGGILYRTADRTLAALHLPFGWIAPRARIILGGLALSTAFVSLLSGWLLPTLFAKVDLTTHTQQRRAAAEAAHAARLAAAQSAAAAPADSHGAEKAHGGADAHGSGGHGGGAAPAKAAGGHGH